MTRLEELPARIDDLTSQVSQLRTEMRGDFSAVRSEMATGFGALRSEMTAGFAAVAVKTDKLEAQTDGLATKTDRLEAKTDGLAVQMRMLHEDVIARIALLQEGLTGTAGRKPKKK